MLGRSFVTLPLHSLTVVRSYERSFSLPFRLSLRRPLLLRSRSLYSIITCSLLLPTSTLRLFLFLLLKLALNFLLRVIDIVHRVRTCSSRSSSGFFTSTTASAFGFLRLGSGRSLGFNVIVARLSFSFTAFAGSLGWSRSRECSFLIFFICELSFYFSAAGLFRRRCCYGVIGFSFRFPATGFLCRSCGFRLRVVLVFDGGSFAFAGFCGRRFAFSVVFII